VLNWQQLYCIKISCLLCPLPIVPAQKKSAHTTATAKNVYGIIKKKMKIHTAQGNQKMASDPDEKAQKKRLKVQIYFWNIVGSVEHINIPKLEDALKKEFHNSEDRFVEYQIRLMQAERRIKVQGNEKVWVNQPPN
jgi:hypothetical protein